MTLPRFTHIMPSSLDEALDLLQEKGDKGCVKAGGSHLMVAMKHRTTVPAFVINIKGLEELDFIRTGPEGGMVIGSLTTLSTVSQSDQVTKQFPILARPPERLHPFRSETLRPLAAMSV